MISLKFNARLTVKLFSLTLILIALTGYQKASAQMFFSNVEGSRVRISGSNNNSQITPITKQFSCEGQFTMVDGQLQYLSALKFNLPINSAKNQGLISTAAINSAQPKNDINFELTHSMVLPELNMIHAIGYLDIQGVKTRVDFHLDYLENNNETITVMGKRSIKLSDYKKDPISIFASAKTQDIIQLDLKLVIKNPAKVEYIAAVVE